MLVLLMSSFASNNVLTISVQLVESSEIFERIAFIWSFYTCLAFFFALKIIENKRSTIENTKYIEE